MVKPHCSSFRIITINFFSVQTFWALMVYRRDYHNVPKFLDGQVWANSADPDQTAARGAV